MNAVDIVRSAFDYFGNPDRYSLYSDDFQWTDSLGSPPMDKGAWVGMGQMMEASFPDIEYVIEDINEEGDTVKVVGHFVGTFTNDLDLSPMGMDVIPASGEKTTWPSNTDLITVEGKKITRIHNPGTGPDAGLAGFLKAIGVG